MPTSKAASTFGTRATHTVQAKDIAEILCHRKVNGVEEYLARWKTNPVVPVASAAPCSWHPLDELWDALSHVQIYLDSRPRGRASLTLNGDGFAMPSNRKRKSPDSDEPRELTRNGFLATSKSRSPSVFAADSVIDLAAADTDEGPRIYNAVLQKRAGKLLAQKPNTQLSDIEVVKVNAKTLPTVSMIEIASQTPVTQAEEAIRLRFLEMLRPVRGVKLENDEDRSTPSLNFTFISDYRYHKGVSRPEEAAYEGCDKCRPDMGQNIGCEYTQRCGCLEYAAVDEQRLERYPDLNQKYKAEIASGDYFPEGLPKRFPYSAPHKDDPRKPQRLVTYYLDRRHPIYECNQNCRCGPRCKSRLVQKGRRVPLTLFKTPDRGWGIKCDENLVRGEFLDTYVGEVITNEEATRREQEGGPEKDSYLYALNKFVDSDIVGDVGISDENCHVVDGQYYGGVSRFINHSCEPNCRQYTVHYDKNNFMLYTLAFFAYEDIPAGTELTFDYQDKDEEELDVAVTKREAAFRDPANRDKIRCNCGAEKCRGFLW